MTTDLDARYGRTTARARQHRLIAIAAGIGTAVVVGAWVVWAGLFSPEATLETRDVGYDLVSDDEVVLRFEVSVTPGASVRCALEVQNEQHAIVGWKVVDLPGSDTYTRVFEERIITSEPAVVGLISECRLT